MIGGLGQKGLKLLLKLRASVIHGGAPDVYDSEKYHRYLETYPSRLLRLNNCRVAPTSSSYDDGPP